MDCIPQVSDNQPRGPAEVRFGVVVVARCLLMDLCTIAAWKSLSRSWGEGTFYSPDAFVRLVRKRSRRRWYLRVISAEA